VVVAATDSAGAVARTLASLGCRHGTGRVEVIVAAARDRVAPPPSDRTFPGVRWVVAGTGTGVPRLRRLGLDRAAAPVVAFTEDSCLFGPGWAEAWVAAFGDPRVEGATGPVVPAMGDAAIDWAVFFCEYAPFLEGRTWIDGPPTRLAGNNFAVRRRSAVGLDGPEIHETDVARMLGGPGGRLVGVAAARAGHVRSYAPRDAIGDRLRFGHAYGQLRARSWSPRARLAGFFAGPLILGVQAARLSAIVLARRRHVGAFVAVLPIILGLLSAWSVGEWLGWLTAPRALGRPTARRRRGSAAPPDGRRPAPAGSRSGRCTAAPPAA
jgi:hypothetical protein